ncbi:MAG: glycosyltransferase family 4 protein [Gemmatimonadales bacterium]
MHLGIEATYMANEWRGIGRYARQLLRHFARLRPDLRLTLYAETPEKRAALAAELPVLGFGAERSGVADVSALRSDPPELAWYPWNKTKYFSRARRMVVTIHDLGPFHHPYREWWRGLDQWKREYRVRKTAARADLILTDSAYSRTDIITRLGVPAEKVRAVHLAADDFTPAVGGPDRAGLAARFGVGEAFFLFAGAADDRKNLPRLREAFLSLHGHGGGGAQLVICGQGPPEGEAEPGVLWLGRVSEADLQALYRAARAFVLPSLLEGFGLPVLEAMASGTPVICSNTTSLPEVAGEAALYIDPLDVNALADQMLRCRTDAALCADLSARGLIQSRRFRWEDTARQTLAAFDSVLATAVPG